jgi:hypothetical protein
MFILDSLLVGTIRFVLDKVAAAVDQEMNDDAFLREELLAAQMRAELGEISPEQFTEIERAILERLREIKERRERESSLAEIASGEMKVTGVEATVEGDEGEVEP